MMSGSLGCNMVIVGANQRQMPSDTVSNGESRLQSSRPLRIHGTVARDLGLKIVSGEYQPGYLLGNEVTASDQLSVSRTAYREAVRILAAKGLVDARPKVGTRVCPRKNWHLLDPDVLGWIFHGEPDENLLASLFELRRIIEPEAAALAAKRRTDGQLWVMHTALQDMQTHTLAAPAGRAADRLFHATMLDAACNDFLSSLTSGVGSAIAWTTEFKQRKGPLVRDPIPDHEKVLKALHRGDGDAARRAMLELVDWAHFDTTGSMRSVSAKGLSQRPKKRLNKT